MITIHAGLNDVRISRNPEGELPIIQGNDSLNTQTRLFFILYNGASSLRGYIKVGKELNGEYEPAHA